MHLFRLGVASGICILGLGCGSSGTGPDGSGGNGPPRQVTVRATDAIAFNPTPADIAIGGTVTFAFEGTAHSVHFQSIAGAPADIPGNNANTNVARTFSIAGTYDYECQIHPGMTGRIVARESGSSGGGGPGPGYP
ncbi:MAG TPA: plastocyanin/azurin family copper-binding protein [Gemmatimonadaceae bacterium]|nr:plastocyanin/azurin family copper-binding protein [Gemmatimonadaceae bacterium]